MPKPHALLVALLLACASCVSLDYDLSGVPVPISAKPAAPGGGTVEPFTLKAHNMLYVHGLFGHSEPDVAAMVAEKAQGYDRIAGFRVVQKSGFAHWLLAHLSLTLVRMRTVEIEGQLVRD